MKKRGLLAMGKSRLIGIVKWGVGGMIGCRERQQVWVDDNEKLLP
jgi:hypothetical protein